MKHRGKRRRFFLPLTLLLLLPAWQAAGVELTALFNLGNLGFDPQRAITDSTYPGTDYYWGASFEVTHGFSEGIAIRGGFYRTGLCGRVSGHSIRIVWGFKEWT